jgi:hypothetical protein
LVYLTRSETPRLEAHIFVAFLAYCLHVSLRARVRVLAPGLTPRALLEKFAAIQMLAVHFPTTDGRELIVCRYTSRSKITRCCWLNWVKAASTEV